MVYFNSNGYKIIYSIENLLRKYIIHYLPEDEFPESKKSEAINNAKNNNVNNVKNYNDILQWIHIGQLYDIIKSKEFFKRKENSINQVDISILINHRNNIMHSREISLKELKDIKEACCNLVDNLNDELYKNQWDKELSNINNIKLPELFVEYPCGKDFIRLIGRDKELKEITKQLESSFPISIVGHGGLGKTALVLQLVENFIYSPIKPFDKIYFMSFKNSMYTDGKIKRFEKVISNYNDLIYRLAGFMEYDPSINFTNLEEMVWKRMFEEKSLLVIDNLETEIVRSNMGEFVNIAKRFISNFEKNSRLIITSRFGLGDSEIKYPLDAFDQERTRELLLSHLTYNNIKINNDEWEWIQKYSQGNPSLIIALAGTIKSSRKEINKLILEFDSKFSVGYIELDKKKNIFLSFCFENTIDSLNDNAKIFLICLAYICDKINLYEINIEFIIFISQELKLEERLGYENIQKNNLENISFLQRRGSIDFYVNELLIDYLKKLPPESNTSMYRLKKLGWFKNIEDLILRINKILNNEDYNLQNLIKELYIEKYNREKNTKYLLDAFLCTLDPKILLKYFRASNENDILNNIHLIKNLKSVLMNPQYKNLQESFADVILNAMIKVRELAKQDVTGDFRQRYLIEYFECLENNLYILKNNKVSNKVRVNICRLLNSLGKPEKAEKYLDIEKENMLVQKFDVYSRLISKWQDTKEKREGYINKCNMILTMDKGFNINASMKSRFYINSANFYLKDSPEKSFEIINKIDNISVNGKTQYANYLQSLLIKAESLIKMNRDINDVEKYIKDFVSQSNSDNYKKNIWGKKQKKLNSQYTYIKRILNNVKSKKM